MKPRRRLLLGDAHQLHRAGHRARQDARLVGQQALRLGAARVDGKKGIIGDNDKPRVSFKVPASAVEVRGIEPVAILRQCLFACMRSISACWAVPGGDHALRAALQPSRGGRRGKRPLAARLFSGNKTIPWWAISLSLSPPKPPRSPLSARRDWRLRRLRVSADRLRLHVRSRGSRTALPAQILQGEMLTAYQLIDRRFGHTLHKVTRASFCSPALPQRVCASSPSPSS